MTITLITASGLIAGTAHTFALAGDELFVARGVTWGSLYTDIASTSLGNVSATFAGDVIANGLGLVLSGNNSVVRILATGSLTAYEINAGNSGIYLGGSGSNLINGGQVTAAQSIGVLSFGGNQIINRGTIDAASGVLIGLAGASNDILINSGQISGNSFGDASNSVRYNNGVIAEGNNSRIVNLAGGTISASSSEGAGVLLHNSANGSTVENHGEIVSVNYFGVSFHQLLAGNTGSLFNDGLITGASGSFLGSAQADDVTNRGVMNGDVSLEGGADLFDGRGGSVDGNVMGGLGDDIYIVDDATINLVENAAEGTDLVKSTVSYRLGDNFENLTLLTHKNINGVGNNDANVLTGNAGNNRLQGQAGNDVLNGAHGDDKLLGSFGNDTLQGGKGDDILKGGLDNDLLQMGNGDDFGYGGKGNDTLEGARGDDTLKGGTGQDILTGGLGDDVFLFTRKLHSTNAASDSITDFTSGEDLIDLSDLNGTFDFIGNAAFSGAAKEVRFFSVGADRTVEIDVDGDGSTDMTILVNSATALAELDFVL